MKPETETLDKLYLEWSQFTKAETKTELTLKSALRQIQKRASDRETVESAFVHQVVNGALNACPSTASVQYAGDAE